MTGDLAKTRNVALIQARVRSGLSKDEIALFVGVHVDTYCKWEQGRAIPRLRNLGKLCEILKASPEDLGYHPNSIT